MIEVPNGDLRASRVVADAATPLADALDRRLTGYVVLRPAEPVAPDDGAGVVTMEDGVPVVAYHDGTDRGGPAALGPLAGPGPYRAELYATDAAALEPLHSAAELRVDPGAPAEQVADAPELAARARERAPTNRESPETDPVEAFLDDEERVEAIKERARAEAERRASEWGFDEVVE